MARLVFYQKEWKVHKEAYEKKIVGNDDTQFIAKKLMRHFKIRCKVISGGTQGGGRAWINSLGSTIRVPRECPFGVLCHELSHVWQHKREGKTKHNKGLARLIQRMVNYCKKKGYWETELAKRNEPKPTKPEPTAQELRAAKIERRKTQIKRIESKIGYYQTLLKKRKRSLGALERAAS